MDELSDLKPIAELASLLPLKDGKPRSIGCIRRWIARGVRGIRLQGWHIGGEWHSSEAAIREFIRRTNPEVVPPPVNEHARHAAVRRILEAEGFFEGQTIADFRRRPRSKRNADG